MDRRVARLIVCLVGVILLLPVIASAQDSGGFTPQQIAQNARMVALVQNRPAAEAALRERWAVLTSDGGDELGDALSRLSYPRLLRAQDAQTIEELDAVIYGAAAGADVPDAIGDNSADLLFTPITPCRIVNTRNISAPLVPAVIRGFDTNLANFSGQGGSATDCGLPGSDTAALAVTITVVAPTGPGNLRAWPYGIIPVPTASVINYTNVTGLNLANTTVVPLRQSVAINEEFSVRADVSGTDLIVDVVGYYWSPVQTAVEQFVQYTEEAIDPNISFSVFSPACPAGTHVVSGGFNSANYSGMAHVTSSRPVTGTSIALVSGTNVADRWLLQGVNGASVNTYRAFVVCGSVPGR